MIQSLKGMPDILPGEVEQWQQLERILRDIAHNYGYSEIRTPVLENADLFIKSTGEHTDIVQKEFYRFEDKNGDSISLRPEGTPGTVRALMQHKLLAQKSPQKLYYMGPMFRRERPQKGRFRQFHQMGVEYFGSSAPGADAEVISMLYQICQKLNIPSPKIMLNSLGDETCRPKYREALLNYLQKHQAGLDQTSQQRMQDNPMRVFDSKDEKTQEIMQNAPVMLDYLSDTCKAHFDQVQEQLSQMQIPYEINNKIVRGLDYYTHTAFEVIAQGLGSQNAAGGGGRYNNLIKSFAGQDIPAVGFAMGMERLLMISKIAEVEKAKQCVVLPLSDKAQVKANQLAWSLRQLDWAKIMNIDVVFDKTSMKSGLRAVAKLDPHYVLILGDQELENNSVLFKNFISKEQKEIEYNKCIDFLSEQVLKDKNEVGIDAKL
ncbi:MAG TPA: histidine--tRNA ligase [Oligoflexia bacterium]|nr:histidine--tRNA ligase [Oligoflexia bacterium]HMR24438.1 histidine--tRNA ligase [Oligoflexia bacterium]